MPNAEPTITNTLPNIPPHFIPQMAPYFSNQIRLISEEFSQVDLKAVQNKALQKFTEQSEKNLPDNKVNTDPSVVNFLDSKTRITDEFNDLQSEYSRLQQLHQALSKTPPFSVTQYLESTQMITQNINNAFTNYLRSEKKAFHQAYAQACPDEAKRKALWEMYAKDLRDNMQTPFKQFTQEITDLPKNAFIRYVNSLGREKKGHLAELPKGKTKEILDRKLHYKDSNGKPISIIKDKKTGEPSEIRVEALSLFGTSGNLGDAYAILAAYHGKELPIRIVVPIADHNIPYTDMKDLIAFLICFVIINLLRYFEEKHYKNQVTQAAQDKGISLDNISLVDTQGIPITFSAKMKAEVSRKLQESEHGHGKLQHHLEKTQKQLISLRPTPVPTG